MKGQERSLEVGSGSRSAPSSHGTLSPKQIATLRWLHDFPSNKAAWQRNGRAAYGPPKLWDAMRITGTEGSIVISDHDWMALRGYIIGCPDSEKIYGPNDAGKALIGV